MVAGDELDLGGFKNFIHQHNEKNLLNYDLKYTKFEDIEKFFGFSTFVDYKKNGLFKKEFTEKTIKDKLDLMSDIYDINIEKILKIRNLKDTRDAIKESKNTFDIELERYDKYDLVLKSKIYELMKESYKKEDFTQTETDIFIEKVKNILNLLNNTEDDFERLILLTNEIEIVNISNVLNIYKYISQIEQVNVKINIKKELSKLILTLEFYIDNCLLFSISDNNKDNFVNMEAKFINLIKHVNPKVSLDEFIFPKEAKRYANEKISLYDYGATGIFEKNGNFKLLSVSSALFDIRDNISAFLQKDIQYFGPLRYYPKRNDLTIIKKDFQKEVSEDKSLEISSKLIEKIKFLHKRLRIIIYIAYSKKFRKHIFKNSVMYDTFNKILPDKYKLIMKNVSTSRNIWLKLINSKELQDKLNLWFVNSKKLKKIYTIKVEEEKRDYIDSLGHRRYKDISKLRKLESSKTIVNKVFNCIYYCVDFILIKIERLIRKIFNIKKINLFKLRFIDTGTNTEVTPREMGMGISQMLPILISSLSSKNNTLYLEQPELHLHPAIQMDLTDEFIRSANENNNEFMIETHSEHMLLRIMKRMRHTAEGKVKDESLKLTPDDICLLYVDSHKGKTFIRELKLDNDGILQSKWPNGFFEESYNEMFS